MINPFATNKADSGMYESPAISVLAAKLNYHTSIEIRKGLAAIAVGLIRDMEPEKDIVAQTPDLEEYDDIFTTTGGWKKVGSVVVMDSPLLSPLEENPEVAEDVCELGAEEVGLDFSGTHDHPRREALILLHKMRHDGLI